MKGNHLVMSGGTVSRAGRFLSVFVMIPLSLISLIAQGAMALTMRREAKRNSELYKRTRAIEDEVRWRMQRTH